jgi:endogenous inhibitor of DNA gyrase (YacG/DUF329 family)
MNEINGWERCDLCGQAIFGKELNDTYPYCSEDCERSKAD